MTIEQYEDYMRQQIPGNWRYDYIRLQERREREVGGTDEGTEEEGISSI